MVLIAWRLQVPPQKGGAYNLQLISATHEESGLVHKTIVLVVHNTELDI